MKTMITRRLSLSTIMLYILLLAAACHRDEGAVTLNMSVESMSGGGKMTLNGNVSSWDTGDSVWVNGTAYAVSTDGGSTSVTVPYSDNGYRAIFPARIARNGGSEIVLPAEYHYHTNANGQLLDMPLVATSENSTLLFKHITGALMVKLRNDNGYSLSLDRIIVSSDRYALSGTRDTATANAPRTGTGNELNVSLCFDRQELTLNSGDSAYVMIPVAAVGADNHFTITVRSHHEGTRYTAEKTQSAGGSLCSNTLAHATMALDGTQNASPLFDKYVSDYLIHTPEDFKNMVTAINSNWNYNTATYVSATYQIMNDIDMSGITIDPITNYTGSLINGNSHTISNLTIASATENCALLATMQDGKKIRNLRLNNIKLISNGSASTRYISPILAVSKYATIENCTVTNCIVEVNGTYSSLVFGGIVGRAYSAASTINSCRFESNMSLNSTGTLYYGGIVGITETSSKVHLIDSCIAINDILTLSSTSNAHIGGVLGDSKTSSPSLTKSQWFGHLNATTTGNLCAGGIIGFLNSTTGYLKLNRCIVANSRIDASIPASGSSFIGKLYGKGKGPNYYNITIDTRDTVNMHIPTATTGLSTGNICGGN